MKKTRFSEEQIVGVLKQAEAGVPVKDLCRKHGISDATFYIYGLLPLCKWGSLDGGSGRMRTSIRRQPHVHATAPGWVIRTRTPLQLDGPQAADIEIRFRARRFDLSCHPLESLATVGQLCN